MLKRTLVVGYVAAPQSLGYAPSDPERRILKNATVVCYNTEAELEAEMDRLWTAWGVTEMEEFDPRIK